MVKGKVVLVPFPFDDVSELKVWPAVCLTEPIGIHRHIVLAFISSRTPKETLDSDLILGDSDMDFAQTDLRVSSILRLHRLMTVTDSFIRRELGQLSPRYSEEVNVRLSKLFDL